MRQELPSRPTDDIDGEPPRAQNPSAPLLGHLTLIPKPRVTAVHGRRMVTAACGTAAGRLAGSGPASWNCDQAPGAACRAVARVTAVPICIGAWFPAQAERVVFQLCHRRRGGRASSTRLAVMSATPGRQSAGRSGRQARAARLAWDRCAVSRLPAPGWCIPRGAVRSDGGTPPRSAPRRARPGRLRLRFGPRHRSARCARSAA